ncbi:MAG: succinate dehydrogenase, hydrophobic membrane anchor protein, partial [Pseudomonadales bacterium]|nr:succinate dehydrogenase, hydrophobic membrane anchor protein [Pseudomonadales bacterium]
MVTAVTSFGRSGLSDWLIQRLSAVVMTAYFIFIIWVFCSNPDMTYPQWSELFSQTCVRIFSTFALLSVIAHAWIGAWSVLTDYVTTRLLGAKATKLRL